MIFFVFSLYSKVLLPGDIGAFKDVGLPGDVRFTKEGIELIVNAIEMKELNERHLPYVILVGDLEDYYKTIMNMNTDNNFGPYYTYSEMIAIMDSLHDKYPDLISDKIELSASDTNVTHEGNFVYAWRITAAEDTTYQVLYTGVHHAREPISCNAVVEWARYLLENYSKDDMVTYLLDNRLIYVVPIVNPDGYLFNESIAPGGGGMWRKNRRVNGGGSRGVDNNRNYPYQWGYDDIGSSNNPSSDTYRGPEPASEPENQMIINLCETHNFTLAMNFHSYSDLVLYPWGYDRLYTPDSFVYFHMAEDMGFPVRYTPEVGWSLYTVNGDSDDWMYGDNESKNKIFAFTTELGEDFWQPDKIDEQVVKAKSINCYLLKAAGPYIDISQMYYDSFISGEPLSFNIKIKNLFPQDSIYLDSIIVSSRYGYISGSATAIGWLLSLKDTLVEVLGNTDSDVLDGTVDTLIITFYFNYNGLKFISHKKPVVIGEREILFSDGFEHGLGNWSGDWKTINTGYASQHSLTDSPDGNYGDNRSVKITSKAIDVENYKGLSLSFYAKQDIEYGWDYASLQISSDMTEWKNILNLSGEATWTKYQFDLEGYDKYVYIRFVLDSDANTNADGCYIDSIVLTGVKPDNSGIEEAGTHRKNIYSINEFSYLSEEFSVFSLDGRKLSKNMRLATGIYYIVNNKTKKPRKILIIE